ncbi:hypothetical protein XELAEV_18000080mg [Xenopus laevis]|uniref:G-protein coupled receptors family 1 profile domain-containing protein n=1 Tax=Xenopus laevis TaxID=8355 RepID=A0A974BR26_XENLA|nr:hypothetical protein XELAEV_18000080mg [Xenopus laevis]
MLLSLEIVLVVLTEESLHEPMYIFICNLTFNGMLGSSSFFPKLIIDLLTSSHQISHTGCFLQVLFMMMNDLFEIFSFHHHGSRQILGFVPPLLIPLIYVIRTKSLNVKIFNYLHKLSVL